MDEHIHVPSFLSTVSTVCFFFLTTLPQSHSQPQHGSKFQLCNQPFNCGRVSNISYPFWDDNRPRYCGGSDQFMLNCDHPYPSIQLSSYNFHVLHINTNTYTVKMMLPDLAVNACYPQHDVYLSPSPFRYPETVHHITIFYDCPTGVSVGGIGSAFNCENYKNHDALYAEGREAVLLEDHPGLRDCGRHIQVPTSQGVPPDGGYDALVGALSDGFEVLYTNIEDIQECTRCKLSNGTCGSDDTAEYQFSCHCPDGSDGVDCSHPSGNHWKRVTGGAIAGLLICITICYFICKSSTWKIECCLTTKSNQDIEAFLQNQGVLTVKRYKFSDVKKMTNSFQVKLGQGGFGAVYKGKSLTSCTVAVKILNPSKGNGEEFINEVASISRTSHVNVVTLLGFCLEGRKKALIYEFMPNGSLEKFIYQKRPETSASLSWENLYQIAIGIAQGLEYLHRGCNTRILHFDIKPHNILLDENFCPKISDFGLAKLCPRKESIISMSDARGTAGYVAPEVWNRHFGGVSHKSDVYSYGMMLLEMVGGRKNINAEASHTSEIFFPHWVYDRIELGNDLRTDGVVAPNPEENEIAKRMTMVGLWCIQTFPNDRPTISRVIDMLEGSVNSLEMPPKPVLSSPTRSVPEFSTTSN